MMKEFVMFLVMQGNLVKKNDALPKPTFMYVNKKLLKITLHVKTLKTYHQRTKLCLPCTPFIISQPSKKNMKIIKIFIWISTFHHTCNYHTCLMMKFFHRVLINYQLHQKLQLFICISSSHKTNPQTILLNKRAHIRHFRMDLSPLVRLKKHKNDD